MTDLVTAAQMRGIETSAIESGLVSGLALMELAGAGVVAALVANWPRFAGAGRAMVLCGPGNNGGDGLVIARLLQGRGWAVDVRLYGDPARLPTDARANYDRWQGAVHGLDDPAGDVPDVIVDALFGTGLTRPLPPEVTRVLARVAALRVPVVAVDTPSGLCADTGRNRGAGLPADLTVTFHRAKPGHYLAEGPALCGALVVVDIGLTAGAEGSVHLVDQADRRWLVKRGGHKYSHGHALVMAGGVGKGGAARLAARAALRVGAGVVTLGVPPAALQENAARLDAVMLRRVADAEGLRAALLDQRINALCLGPGLGVPCVAALVAVALEGARPVVLDADALTGFADQPGVLFAALHAGCVLTPHWGEFRRLFPDLVQDADGAARSKIDAVRAAAKRAGCTVLLKGPDTVIADASGRAAISAACYDRAVPWLATAGAGDVLAGIITGLLARGVPPFEAAGIGAWLHVEAAHAFGPGLIAEDLPDMLPKVLRLCQ